MTTTTTTASNARIFCPRRRRRRRPRRCRRRRRQFSCEHCSHVQFQAQENAAAALVHAEQAAEQLSWLHVVEEAEERQRQESALMRDALAIAESVRQREGAADALAAELVTANEKMATLMDEALQKADVDDDDDDDVTWVPLRALLAAEPMSATTTTTAGRVVRERAQHASPRGAPPGAAAAGRGVDRVGGPPARAGQVRQGLGGPPGWEAPPPPGGGLPGERGGGGAAGDRAREVPRVVPRHGAPAHVAGRRG